ncbi:MAG: MCE family protein [Alphaproteobacteria bacterium]|nr:MCE family protein [Alphaproteobacteria bacterium]
MKNEMSEIFIGTLVLFVGIVMFVFISNTDIKKNAEKMYTVTARFNRTDGIVTGSNVRLAGIPVGTVLLQELDENYKTTVTLQIENRIKLPDDTAAVIHTDGLFGSKYIELEPGGMEETIPHGGIISYTQDSMIVEELLEKIIAIGKSKKQQKPKKGNL